MKNILEISRAANGQYTYRVLRDGVELVGWQYGSYLRDETLELARGRFAYDVVIETLNGGAA